VSAPWGDRRAEGHWNLDQRQATLAIMFDGKADIQRALKREVP